VTARELNPDQLSSLRALNSERTRVTSGAALAVLAFFLPLPVLGGFTSLLDDVLFQGVTVAWVYAVAQFVVAIAVARWYSMRAAGFDTRLNTILGSEERP
jgi:uncharacterized membrane protein (DUF485 family)